MADGKKTYYQVSFTSTQALAAVVIVLAALGVSFFLGAKAGFEKSGETEIATARPGPAVPPAATTEAPPTVASTASTTTPSAPPVTSPAPASSAAAAPATEEAPVFEDREAGVPESPAGAGPSRTVIAGGGTATGAHPAAPPRTAAPGNGAPPAAETGKTPAAAKGGFYVQVISTSSKSEAVRWKEKLAAKSYRTAAVSTVESKKGMLYRVRTGPYPDHAQAKKAAARISTEFKQKAWVASE